MGRKVETSFVVSCAVSWLALFAAAPATAAEEHLYDPVLSLTGGTAVSAEDPVADPGPNHPPKSLERPCGTVTDPHGDIYVSSRLSVENTFVGERIDVFDPAGKFLVEFEDMFEGGDYALCGLAVDSEGNLYSGGLEGSRVDLFEPSVYPPVQSTTYSLAKAFKFSKPGCGGGLAGTAIDPSNDHLYVGYSCVVSGSVEEYGSAAEGSLPIKEFAGTEQMSWIDVYGKNHDVYAVVPTKVNFPPAPTKLFVFDGTDGHTKCEIRGDEVSGGIDVGPLGASIAVDQANGDFYLHDTQHGTVYQFVIHGEDECQFVGRLPQPPILKEETPYGDVAVDDPIEAAEPGYDSPNEGYVYVTAGKSASTGHLFAFKPKVIAPPEIEDQEATDVAETEATLRARLNPSGLDTEYHFEYLTEAAYQTNGESFSGPESPTSVPVPDADAGEGGAFALVSEPIADLQPDTAYRFRLVASNCEGAEPVECLTRGEGTPGGEGEDASFATYPVTPGGLPDHRAYELVTPPDTNGRIPTMGMLGPFFTAIGFGTTLASPNGDSVAFGSNSGALPGLGGGGFEDTYEAFRDPASGWHSHFTGLSAVQAVRPRPGGISPDHGFSFWKMESEGGSLADPEKDSTLLRVPPGVEASPNCAPEAEPEGRFEWIGCGSLGHDSMANGKWISEGGDHVIFVTGNTGGGASPPVQLEPCAPPNGIQAIYDRRPDGPTRCVSVPPAGASVEVQAQFKTERADYKGTSADGRAVAFEVAGTLYVRIDNTETVEVAEGEPTFGGISRDGNRVFYLKGASLATVPRGEIFACEVAAGPCVGPEAEQEPIQVGSGVESSLVNVSADGSHAYFVSPEQLDGEEGEEGEDNLYVWDGKTVRFIATLDPADIDGEGDAYGQGLGLWVTHFLDPSPVYTVGPADDPSHTTPDGKVFIFLSHADLAGSNGDGHWQLFRYDTQAEAGKRLRCLSCNPTAAPATSDARLQRSEEAQLLSRVPLDSLALISNVTEDGKRVFFESGDRLVPADLDGKVDVYEWQAQGAGGCERAAGCLALISGSHSAEDDFLYAMTPDGHDVFFQSADTLVAQDPDGTPSIYDARVDGGFPPGSSPPGECLGEACQPAVAAPSDATPATSGHEGPGNPKAGLKRACSKGKRPVRRAGKARCVKRTAQGRHRKRHNHRRAAR